jgi:hypothetical protein
LNCGLNNGLFSWRGISSKNNISFSTNNISFSFNKVVMPFDIIFLPDELVFISPDPISIAVDRIVIPTDIVILSVDLVIYTVDNFVVGSVENVCIDDLAVSENEGRDGEETHFFNHFVCFDRF